MLIADLHERLRQHVLSAVRSRQITQKGLGELVGTGQAHISNFLRGRRGLSLDAMDAILKVLGLDVTSLIVISGKTPSNSSPTIESVPLVEHAAAMNPTFGKSGTVGELGFSRVLLRRLKAKTPKNRTDWVRFIAIRVDAALAAPMYPRLSNGSVLLVDRHSCLLTENEKDDPNLYLIREERTLMVRWAQMHGSTLYLLPDRSEYPLDFISIGRKQPITSCIVGRVVYIGTELDNAVRPFRS